MNGRITTPSPVEIAHIGQAVICQTKLVSTLIEKAGAEVAEDDIRVILVAIAEMRTELPGFCASQTKLNEQREITLHEHGIKIDQLEKYKDETSTRDKVVFAILGIFGTIVVALATAIIKHMLNI